jgi:hypothetical protein
MIVVGVTPAHAGVVVVQDEVQLAGERVSQDEDGLVGSEVRGNATEDLSGSRAVRSCLVDYAKHVEDLAEAPPSDAC